MKFSFLHKTTAYLGVLSAIGILFFSPDISRLTIAIVLGCIAISWFMEPIRWPIKQWTALWNIITLGFLFYLIIDVWQGASAIVAAILFLLFVVINKLFNRLTSKDYQQIHVVSFLIVVASTTINNSLSYAVFFVFFVVFSVWNLILLHLRREVEENHILQHSHQDQSQRVDAERILNSKRIVGSRFLISTSIFTFGILAAASVLFVFFPRVGFGFFGQNRQFGIAMVGFNEHVQLGHHGILRDNPEVVMRVVVSDRKSLKDIRWRGSAFDHYENGEWSHSRSFLGITQPVAPQGDLYHLNYVHGVSFQLSNEEIQEDLFKQEIYLEPMESNLIFALDRPVAIEVMRTGRRRMFEPRRGPMGEIRSSSGYPFRRHYFAYSYLKQPAPELLGKSQKVENPNLDFYLQLPKSLPDRVRKLAEKITKKHKTIYDKVNAIQKYLQSNYQYTTKLVHDRNKEPVDEFLFETQKGHCEYFASAMVLLLRSIGIHARNINGFAGGDWNSYGKFFVVRHGHAHAWIEVLFSNVGWVTFDPTPPSSMISDELQSGLIATISQFIDSLRLRWFNYVVQYDLQKQMTLALKFRRLFRKDPLQGSVQGLAQYKRPLLFISGILIFIVIVALLMHQRRFIKLPGHRKFRKYKVHPATALYQRALRLLEKYGNKRTFSTTPLEFANSLQAQGFSAANLVMQITYYYYQARYNKDQKQETTKLVSLVDELKRTLATSNANR